MMKKIIPAFASLLLFCFQLNNVFAQEKDEYVLEQKIAVPGDAGYDYLSIDHVNKRLYVSHGTSVNVIDLNTEKVIGSIDGMQGVHGIAIVNDVNKGFISDGKGNAAVAF